MEGEGMVAVVRALRDAELAVTVLDNGRQYTLLPSHIAQAATNQNKLAAAQQHCPERCSHDHAYHHHSYCRGPDVLPCQRSCAPNYEAPMQQKFHGSYQFPRHQEQSNISHGVQVRVDKLDSCTQATDGRYASSYQMSHGNLRPTSPPVELTEFPPQRPFGSYRGRGNFVIGALASGDDFSPTRPLSARGGKCRPERDCSVRSPLKPSSFVESLRKYPNAPSNRSVELIERLINYSQAKQNGSKNMSSSSQNMDVLPSNCKPNNVPCATRAPQRNQQAYLNLKHNWAVTTSEAMRINDGQIIPAAETVRENRGIAEGIARHDNRRDVFPTCFSANVATRGTSKNEEARRCASQSIQTACKDSSVLAQKCCQANNAHTNADLQASPFKVSRKVIAAPELELIRTVTVPVNQLTSLIQRVNDTTLPDVSHSYNPPERDTLRRKDIITKLKDTNTQTLIVQNTITQTLKLKNASTTTTGEPTEMRKHLSRNRNKEASGSKPSKCNGNRVYFQILELVENIPTGKTTKERKLRKETLKKLQEKLRLLSENFEKTQSEYDFLKHIKNCLRDVLVDEWYRRLAKNCGDIIQKSATNLKKSSLSSIKNVTSNHQDKKQEIQNEVQNWYKNMSTEGNSLVHETKSDDVEKFVDRLLVLFAKESKCNEDYTSALKFEILDFLDKIALTDDDNKITNNYVKQKLSDKLLKKLLKLLINRKQMEHHKPFTINQPCVKNFRIIGVASEHFTYNCFIQPTEKEINGKIRKELHNLVEKNNIFLNEEDVYFIEQEIADIVLDSMQEIRFGNEETVISEILELLQHPDVVDLFSYEQAVMLAKCILKNVKEITHIRSCKKVTSSKFPTLKNSQSDTFLIYQTTPTNNITLSPKNRSVNHADSSIEDRDTNDNVETYVRLISEQVREWLNSIITHIPQAREEEFRQRAVKDLARGIVEGHKYNQLNNINNSTEEQLFRWVKTLAGETYKDILPHTPELISRIQGIPVPVLKPRCKKKRCKNSVPQRRKSSNCFTDSSNLSGHTDSPIDYNEFTNDSVRQVSKQNTTSSRDKQHCCGCRKYNSKSLNKSKKNNNKTQDCSIEGVSAPIAISTNKHSKADVPGSTRSPINKPGKKDDENFNYSFEDVSYTEELLKNTENEHNCDAKSRNSKDRRTSSNSCTLEIVSENTTDYSNGEVSQPCQKDSNKGKSKNYCVGEITLEIETSDTNKGPCCSNPKCKHKTKTKKKTTKKKNKTNDLCTKNVCRTTGSPNVKNANENYKSTCQKAGEGSKSAKYKTTREHCTLQSLEPSQDRSYNADLEQETKQNVEQYTKLISTQIDNWLNNLHMHIPMAREEGFRQIVTKDLAEDIVDRHKYEQTICTQNMSDEDYQLEILRFQIFTWINKVVGVNNQEPLAHAPELMNIIQRIPIPLLTTKKPSCKNQKCKKSLKSKTEKTECTSTLERPKSKCADWSVSEVDNPMASLCSSQMNGNSDSFTFSSPQFTSRPKRPRSKSPDWSISEVDQPMSSIWSTQINGNSASVTFSSPKYTSTPKRHKSKNPDWSISEVDESMVSMWSPQINSNSPYCQSKSKERTRPSEEWSPQINGNSASVTFSPKFTSTPKRHKSKNPDWSISEVDESMVSMWSPQIITNSPCCHSKSKERTRPSEEYSISGVHGPMQSLQNRTGNETDLSISEMLDHMDSHVNSFNLSPPRFASMPKKTRTEFSTSEISDPLRHIHYHNNTEYSISEISNQLQSRGTELSISGISDRIGSQRQSNVSKNLCRNSTNYSISGVCDTMKSMGASQIRSTCSISEVSGTCPQELVSLAETSNIEESNEVDNQKKGRMKFLYEQIDKWLSNLNVESTCKLKGIRQIAINDLATDIMDRENFMKNNPRLKSDEKHELDYLRYQIFHWINKFAGENNLETIEHAPELMKGINSSPCPCFTGPRQTEEYQPVDLQPQSPITITDQFKEALVKEITEWWDDFPCIQNQSSTEINEAINRLAMDLNESLRSKPKKPDKIIDKEVELWSKKYLNLNKNAASVGNLKERIKRVPFCKLDTDAERTGVICRKLAKTVEGWLDSLPMCLAHNKKNVVSELVKLIEETKCKFSDQPSKVLDKRLQKEISDWLSTKKPYSNNKRLDRQEDAAILAKNVLECQSRVTDSETQKYYEAGNIKENVLVWLSHLPLCGMPTNEDTCKFTSNLKRWLDIPNNNNYAELNTEIINFIISLPIDPKHVDDTNFINNETSHLLYSLQIDPKENKSLGLLQRHIYERVINWSANLPLQKDRCPTSTQNILDHLILALTNLTVHPERGMVEENKQLMKNEIIRHLKQLPVEPATQIEPYISEMARALWKDIEDIYFHWADGSQAQSCSYDCSKQPHFSRKPICSGTTSITRASKCFARNRIKNRRHSTPTYTRRTVKPRKLRGSDAIFSGRFNIKNKIPIHQQRLSETVRPKSMRSQEKKFNFQPNTYLGSDIPKNSFVKKTISQIREELGAFIRQWCAEIPIDEDSLESVTVDEVKHILCETIQKFVLKLESNEVASSELLLCRKMLEDAIDDVFDLLPDSIELEIKRYSMKTRLIDYAIQYLGQAIPHSKSPRTRNFAKSGAVLNPHPEDTPLPHFGQPIDHPNMSAPTILPPPIPYLSSNVGVTSIGHNVERHENDTETDEDDTLEYCECLRRIEKLRRKHIISDLPFSCLPFPFMCFI